MFARVRTPAAPSPADPSHTAPRCLATMRVIAALIVAALAIAACGEDLPSMSQWTSGHSVVRGEAPLAYISDNGSDTVSIVELRTMTLRARLPVGLDIVQREAPHHLVAAADLGALYVGLSNVLPSGLVGIHADHGGGDLDSYVQRLDIADLSPDGWVRVDSNLGDIVRVPGTSRFVTSHFDLKRALDTISAGDPIEEASAALVVIDGETMQRIASLTICIAPHGVAINSAGLAAVACYGEDTVAVVDLTASPPALRARVPVGAAAQPLPPPTYGPYAMTLSPDGSRAFVGLTEGRGYRVLDMASAAMMPGMVADVTGAAFFGAFSPDGATFYGPTQQLDTIVAIDAATLAPVASATLDAEVCVAPHVIEYIAALDELMLVCEGDHRTAGTLVALDPVTLEVRAFVAVGVYPDGISVVDEVSW